MKSWLTGKDPDEKTEGKRRKGQERIRWLDTITNLMDTNLSEVCETVEDRGAWRVAVHGFAKSWTRLSDWKITTATMATIFLVCFFLRTVHTVLHSGCTKIHSRHVLFECGDGLKPPLSPCGRLQMTHLQWCGVSAINTRSAQGGAPTSVIWKFCIYC